MAPRAAPPAFGIETIVVRPGDYSASFAVASNPAAIIAIADDIGWQDAQSGWD